VRRPRLAVLGGTFDHLHVGHLALLAAAFRIGDGVAIGVTTDRFLAEHPKPYGGRIQPYVVRRAALVRWLRAHYPRGSWRVSPLEDPFGRSTAPEVGVLIVSRDTEKGGRAVNRERRRLGRRTIPMVSVPLVLADDLEPVSSRRIRAGEIRADGRRRSPIRVRLVTPDRRDREPAELAVGSVFPRARILSEVVSPPTGPRSGRRSSGARARSTNGFDLEIRVSRRPRSGWSASERSRRVRLRPRTIRGSRPNDLERGLAALLRPRG